MKEEPALLSQDSERLRYILLLVGLFYILSPVDFVPDFLPIGQADDALVFLIMIYLVFTLARNRFRKPSK